METRNERDKLKEGRRQAEEEAATLRRESANIRASLDEKLLFVGGPRGESSKCVIITVIVQNSAISTLDKFCTDAQIFPA